MMKARFLKNEATPDGSSTPTGRGQMTINGVIGNTRHGIRVDDNLNPVSTNPISNKAVTAALAALAEQLAKGQLVFVDRLPETGEPQKIYVLTTISQRYW